MPSTFASAAAGNSADPSVRRTQGRSESGSFGEWWVLYFLPLDFTSTLHTAISSFTAFFVNYTIVLEAHCAPAVRNSNLCFSLKLAASGIVVVAHSESSRFPRGKGFVASSTTSDTLSKVRKLTEASTKIRNLLEQSRFKEKSNPISFTCLRLTLDCHTDPRQPHNL